MIGGVVNTLPTPKKEKGEENHWPMGGLV